jgi:hypothetical protein
MKPLRTFVSIVTAVLVVASMPASVTARSPRMQAIRELPVAVQSERAAQLQQYVTRTGALGTYWDTASDQIVVVTPASGTSSFKTTDLDSLGLDLRVETRDIQPEVVDEIESQLRDWKWDPSARGTAFLSYFDAKKGKVVIASDAAPTAFQYFQGRFPGQVEFMQAGLELQSRKNDTAPHWGGAELDYGSNVPQCTSAFAVRRGSERTMLTAKHCFPLFQ